ncbi:DUF4239 domain-containing protein [Streptomyces sp. HNM0574]|uniref:bestrophin-like domain n=1 Tax=Streptomyces sp. HNM0574 TaxID=2714954 RepID=UPI00146F034C|nr:DUF4239 domain-containing protein [Streptomyces sp. HNM0574]NLU68720.1 DUF4239 domain-containing protein [Streptomyces sp. HNM0574]
MSDWMILTLGTVAACAVVLLIVVLRQRRAGDDDDPSETPDVIEYMTMMIGVVYAIVLGLAIAGVWEARNVAEDVVRTEAQSLHEIRERAQVYPEAERDRIQKDVDAYVRFAVDKEWPHMAKNGELLDRGDALLAELRQQVTAHKPADVQEEQTYQAMTERVAALDAARAERAASAEPTMPGVVWVGLIAGAAVSVAMLFTLQIQRSGRELLLAGLFTALVAFLLFLVWHFDSPYARGLDDSTEPFLTLFPHVV